MNSNRPFTLVCCFIFFLLTGTAACGTGEKKNPPLEKRELTIERSGGGAVRLAAELARTGEERERGLMFRESLPDGEGMLFIFERDEPQAFWMKNTLIPLSIAYISHDGRIVDIRDMRPKDLTSVWSSRSIRYALEVPQGWFRRSGIAEGDRLVLDF